LFPARKSMIYESGIVTRFRPFAFDSYRQGVGGL